MGICVITYVWLGIVEVATRSNVPNTSFRKESEVGRSMVKQRSKAEFLAFIRTSRAMKKDAGREDSITWKTVFFRMNVVWCMALWKDEKFSQNDMVDFLQYVRSENYDDFKKNRRKEVQDKLQGKGVDWEIRENRVYNGRNNAIDNQVRELMKYNTEVSVDYCLLACEYLIDHKGYGKKRLNRVIGNVHFMDALDSLTIVQMRKDIFDHKGIWIELTEHELPEEVEHKRI